jgi:hypothetical protein
MNDARMTPTTSTSSLQSFASDLDFETFADINKRTLDTHKWFKKYILLAKNKMQDERIAAEIKKKIAKNTERHILLGALLSFAILSYMIYCHHMLFIMRLCVLLVWMVDTTYMFNRQIELESIKDYEIKLYMRFTRNGLFYQNTHYLFAGSKRELEKVMSHLRNEVYNFRIENKDSRDEHDKLNDMPLDTFCTDDCRCNAADNENYECSRWELYNYDSQKELEEDIEKVENLKEGFPNEIIYI